MAAPFTLKNPASSRGLLRRLTGDKDAALAEINNVFARAPSISRVTHRNISVACEKHRTKLEKISHEGRAQLYERYVAYAFRDKVVEEDELGAINRLQELLALDETAAQRAYWDPILEIYGKEVDEVISDGTLTDADKERLRKLEKDLRISPEHAKRVYHARAEQKVKEHVAAITEDAKVSPDEELELRRMCESLDVHIEWGDSKLVFARFRENWRLEHGELEPMAVAITLRKGEHCFASRGVAWYETRRITKRVSYSGPTARFRIMKGVYWRAGSVGVQRIAEDVMTHIDSGTVYLTNRRLVFMGALGNKAIRLPRILDYEVYSNGVSIQKDAGKSPFLQFEENPEHFGVLLGRMLAETS